MMVSSFGFGGTNGAAIIEGWKGQASNEGTAATTSTQLYSTTGLTVIALPINGP